MTILVTGSNGQLGSEVRRAAAGGVRRYLFTDVAELDITDQEAVLRMVKEQEVKIIINCAAYTNVDKAEDEPETANLLNNKAAANLAKAALANDAALIHISTDYVFDGRRYLPYTETDEPSPTGVYGRTKLAGEQAVVESGCRHIIVRTSWLYSRWGNNFVKTMLRLTGERDELSVIFDQIGTPTYAGDLADGIVRLIDQDLADRQGVYHFSNEGVCSWYDFALAVCKLGGHTCSIRPIHSADYASKVKRPHYSVLDKMKFRETFGFRIPYWMDSLEKCIRELKESDNGI